MEFCVDSWWFAPKGTPAEAVAGFADALEEAAQTDRITTFFESQMFAPVILKGEALQASLDETWERIQPVAQRAAKK
jgi:tripartite-type tricarboxylate transporter receptor subunit TctC